MKSSLPLSLLFLLPSIRAAVLPQLFGDELESTSSSQKRDESGVLIPRSPEPEFSEMRHEDSKPAILPEAAASMTDNPSLDPDSNSKRDLSARTPQGPSSNPGEFTGIDLSRANPANRDAFANSSSSSHPENGQGMSDVVVDSNEADPSLVDGGPPSSEVMMEDDGEWKDDHHHNGSQHFNGSYHQNGSYYHNGSHHHRWNDTHHGHREEGVLTAFNAHGEHIVVYNGTHYPNGTSYSPANETIDGGQMLEKVLINGDEIVVYRQPWNETRHHHHNHQNLTVGPMPTATGVWLPSGTGWIPSGTGRPRHHRKVPSPAYAGFRGPKKAESLRESSKHAAGRIKYGTPVV